MVSEEDLTDGGPGTTTAVSDNTDTTTSITPNDLAWIQFTSITIYSSGMKKDLSLSQKHTWHNTCNTPLLGKNTLQLIHKI